MANLDELYESLHFVNKLDHMSNVVFKGFSSNNSIVCNCNCHWHISASQSL